jgi:hypothetical protein
LLTAAGPFHLPELAGEPPARPPAGSPLAVKSSVPAADPEYQTAAGEPVERRRLLGEQRDVGMQRGEQNRASAGFRQKVNPPYEGDSLNSLKVI